MALHRPTGSIVPACPCLVSLLPSCLKPREVFVPQQGRTPAPTLLHPQHKANRVMQGTKGEMLPFLLEHKMSSCPASPWFHSGSYRTKISNFRTSWNFKCSEVLISHLFLYNERNTWVDKKDQPQPREQRSLSSVISC